MKMEEIIARAQLKREQIAALYPDPAILTRVLLFVFFVFT
jgi:hypothetical protein